MDPNTILLIAFVVMMLFCCGGMDRLFKQRRSDSVRNESSSQINGNVAGMATQSVNEQARRSGGCH